MSNLYKFGFTSRSTETQRESPDNSESNVTKHAGKNIQDPDSKWKRLKMSKELKGGFCQETEQQYLVLVQFVGVHSNHVTSKFSAYGNRLDEQVILNIKLLAKEGVTNVSEMQRGCEQLSQDILPDGHNKSDRSSTKDDQMKVAEVIGDWQGSAEEGSNIFFRPMEQAWQRWLGSKKNGVVDQKDMILKQLYWQCRSCIEWYHPDCLGLNESKEPDDFICPACQDNL